MTKMPDVGEALRPLIEAVTFAVQPLLLARLERAAADRYRAWAESCGDAARAEGFRGCAAREEEIAARVENAFPLTGAAEAEIGRAVPEIGRVYLSAFAGRPLADQWAIQAAAERRGAEAWRAFAASVADPSLRETLLGCAPLEERSAEFLEHLAQA